MLRKFAFAYKHRRIALAIRILVLITLAPFAVKTLENITVEESEYLPEGIESVEGDEILSEVFSNASFGSGLQLVYSGELTREKFLELQSVAEEFVEAGYASNVSSPIEKSLEILVPYAEFLSYQTVYENATISAVFMPIEVYVGVRRALYQATHNHTYSSLEALGNATIVAESFEQAVGNRTVPFVEAFHAMRVSEDPEALAANPAGYADSFVDGLATNFGPYVSAAAAHADLADRRERDPEVRALLKAAIPAASEAILEPEEAIRDLFTRPVDSGEIANKLFAKGYVKALVMGAFAPSGINPLFLRDRLGISMDGDTAYADLITTRDSDEFYRDVRSRRQERQRDGYSLTGIGLMRTQISDEAKSKTHNIHFYDVAIITVVLAIVLRALPASIGPVLIIGSAIILAEGLLYRMHVLFDVAISEVSISVMVTAMLGAGVDYAVFMSSRYLEERGRGRSREEAVLGSIEHAGRSLLTSGGTIAIAFGVLAFSSFKMLQGLGIAVALGISMSVLAALTLMPAILGALGDKFFRPRRIRYEASRFESVGRRTIRHKKAVLLAVLVVFGGLSYVAINAETSYDMIRLMPDVPSKEGLETLINEFGSFMMPVIVLAKVGPEEIAHIDEILASIEGVVDVRSYEHPLSYHIAANTPFRSMIADAIRGGFYRDGRSMHVVIIAYNPYTRDAFRVVEDIRNSLSGFERYVTGVAAMYYDISTLVNEDFSRLAKIVISAIVAFLLAVFGSILIPLRLEGTVLLNIGGTLGFAYLVLRALDMPLARITPIALFVVLNGLGMDYDIFLVTRIMEERSKGLPEDDAIVEAVANTMRVITACGIIMASSFGVLLTTGMPITIQLGLGLAAAVIFDTFVMRAFFVPAFMSVAGKRNRRAPRILKKAAMYRVERFFIARFFTLMEPNSRTKSRKIEHLLIVLSKDVEFEKSTLFECVELLHDPINDADFDLEDESFSRTRFLEHRISMPFMIGAMTGGHPDTKIVNELLAQAAEEFRIPIATGSVKAALRSLGGDPGVADTYSVVKDIATSVPRLSNLGIEDLVLADERGKLFDALHEAVEILDAHAIQIHVNPLQEIVQKGRVKQAGILRTLQRISERSSDSGVTVIIKEVGSGFSPSALNKLAGLGFGRIDVEGAGGTSRAKVEELRGGFAGAYAERGIPTAAAVIYAVRAGFRVISGGGIRNGLDVVKSLVLGAELAASALGALRALFPRRSLDPDYENLRRFLRHTAYEIRMGVYLLGARNVGELRETKNFIIKPPLTYYLNRPRGSVLLSRRRTLIMSLPFKSELEEIKKSVEAALKEAEEKRDPSIAVKALKRAIERARRKRRLEERMKFAGELVIVELRFGLPLDVSELLEAFKEYLEGLKSRKDPKAEEYEEALYVLEALFEPESVPEGAPEKVREFVKSLENYEEFLKRKHEFLDYAKATLTKTKISDVVSAGLVERRLNEIEESLRPLVKPREEKRYTFVLSLGDRRLVVRIREDAELDEEIRKELKKRGIDLALVRGILFRDS